MVFKQIFSEIPKRDSILKAPLTPTFLLRAEEEKEGDCPTESPSKTIEPPSELEIAVSTVLLHHNIETDTLSEGSSSSGVVAPTEVTASSGTLVARSGMASGAASDAMASSSSSDDTVPVVAIIEDDSPRLTDRFFPVDRGFSTVIAFSPSIRHLLPFCNPA